MVEADGGSRLGGAAAALADADEDAFAALLLIPLDRRGRRRGGPGDRLRLDEGLIAQQRGQAPHRHHEAIAAAGNQRLPGNRTQRDDSDGGTRRAYLCKY